MPLLQAFPFPSTLGEVTLHLLSQAGCLLTVHVGGGSSPLSCGVFLPSPLLQAFPFLIVGLCCCSCRPACLSTAHMGGGSFSLSCGVYLPLPLSQAFPLLVAGCAPQLPPFLTRPGLFIYSSGWDSPPPALALRVPHPLCYMSLLFLLLVTQFLFFPQVGSVCPGGYADLAQGCLWKYRVPLSSPCGPHLPKPSGLGHLAARGPSWFLSSM
jgi:hypothetical protein